MSATNLSPESLSTPWPKKIVLLIEAICNMLFYLFALFILVIPLFKWLADLFSKNSSPLMVAIAALVFAIILPAVMPILADWSMTMLEKIRKGEFLSTLFRPLRAICAVVSIFGVLALEYKTIHGNSGKSLLEVYFDLIKAL